MNTGIWKTWQGDSYESGIWKTWQGDSYEYGDLENLAR